MRPRCDRRSDDPELPDGFETAWEAMWAIFWVVTTLGYDGNYGRMSAAAHVIYGVAIVFGIVFTTMPITVIGEAFASSWEVRAEPRHHVPES